MGWVPDSLRPFVTVSVCLCVMCRSVSVTAVATVVMVAESLRSQSLRCPCGVIGQRTISGWAVEGTRVARLSNLGGSTQRGPWKLEGWNASLASRKPYESDFTNT